jgi:hypothetical protein
MMNTTPQTITRRRNAMTTMTWGMISDFYLGDMRLKNRTTDSINTNAGNLRRFVAWRAGYQVGGRHSGKGEGVHHVSAGAAE